METLLNNVSEKLFWLEYHAITINSILGTISLIVSLIVIALVIFDKHADSSDLISAIGCGFVCTLVLYVIGFMILPIVVFILIPIILIVTGLINLKQYINTRQEVKERKAWEERQEKEEL